MNKKIKYKKEGLKKNPKIELDILGIQNKKSNTIQETEWFHPRETYPGEKMMYIGQSSTLCKRLRKR